MFIVIVGLPNCPNVWPVLVVKGIWETLFDLLRHFPWKICDIKNVGPKKVNLKMKQCDATISEIILTRLSN